jgi:hypothetical protein
LRRVGRTYECEVPPGSGDCSGTCARPVAEPRRTGVGDALAGGVRVRHGESEIERTARPDQRPRRYEREIEHGGGGSTVFGNCVSYPMTRWERCWIEGPC